MKKITFKQFKTKIRKIIGYVGVGKFVEDPIASNPQWATRDEFSTIPKNLTAHCENSPIRQNYMN